MEGKQEIIKEKINFLKYFENDIVTNAGRWKRRTSTERLIEFYRRTFKGLIPKFINKIPENVFTGSSTRNKFPTKIS